MKIEPIHRKETLPQALRKLALMLENEEAGGECCTIIIDGMVIQMGEGKNSSTDAAIKHMSDAVEKLTASRYDA